MATPARGDRRLRFRKESQPPAEPAKKKAPAKKATAKKSTKKKG